ncbi:hypothetical protein [Campylobacter helveticus]|uniref:hypothetical protein n=1 Tax=Campylobacter helveticus TaxID=28898 RepID=UPI0022EAA9E8|nr:hypothetical protein [Campylobacter helveticus]
MQNDIRIIEFENQVLELQDDLYYTNAQVIILQAAQTCIHSYILDETLKFVKANKLGGYDNFYCAGLYIEEAILEMRENYGITYCNAKQREAFHQSLSKDLFKAIGEKVLREADDFLKSHLLAYEPYFLTHSVELRSDEVGLVFFMEKKNIFLKKLEKLNFNELDKRAEKEWADNARALYFSLKCVLNHLK